MTDTQPFISIIIPVRNGSECLSRCLNALLESSYKSYEVIVVDDASTDNSVQIGLEKGAIVLQSYRQSGPAAARNFGAQKARGDILFFVDSDVLVKPDTVTRVADDFIKNPGIAAVFGSYDDDPHAPDFLSQFRNLLHHFTHQHSCNEAKTFWAGCGAIYREVFCQLQGFNERRYPKPSIEDIELGFRMWKGGYRILLDKELQVKHLKHWSLSSLVKTDVFNRAVPWSQLIIENGFMSRDLNLQISHRISAVLVGFLVLMMLLLAFLDALNFLDIALGAVFFTVFLPLAVALFINREVYTFFFQKRGIKFMFFSIPMHFLYYFYSGLSFAICWILNKFSRFRSDLKKMWA